MDAIRLFAISKLGWIKKQQQKLREQDRETPREYLERESHYVWGRRYLLSVVEADRLRPLSCGTTAWSCAFVRSRRKPNGRNRGKLVPRAGWHGDGRLDHAKWEPRVGVRVAGFYVRRMKTRWGSCNSQPRTIRLNTDLAKKPRECLEYIVVHEMIHILEPTHNERFQTYLTRLMPDWEHRRQILNRLPVRHENWLY